MLKMLTTCDNHITSGPTERKKWSRREDDFLEANWHGMSIPKIAAALERKQSGILARARRKGIIDRESPTPTRFKKRGK